MASILVASQTQFGANPICRMLSANHHRLTVANDLEQAMGLIASGGFDVIVLDIGTLTRSLLDRVIALRTNGNSVPVVLVCDASHLESLGYVQLAGQIPSVTVITRPCYFPELLETIDHSLPVHDPAAPSPASNAGSDETGANAGYNPISALHH